MTPNDGPAAPQSDDPPRRGRAALVVSSIALVLSVAAVGLAAWTAFRPTPATPAEVPHTASQQAEAKAKICAAADLVRTGVSVNTNLQSPGGPGDVTGSLAVQANARQALSGGGQYLLAQLDPATPTDLADEVKRFATLLMDIGAAATAGQQNADPQQAARLSDADGGNARIAELCK